MSTLKKNIDNALEELDERAEEEFGPRNVSTKDAIYDAAQRRMDNDWVGRIAILISFMATIFVGMAVSFLNEQKVLTTDGILIIIAGGFIYIGFRLFVILYNFVALKLQHRAIELDIKEAKVRKVEAETDAYKTLKEAEVAERKLLFMKNQNRLDQKLNQDLKLRAPFFEEAQKSMMGFFAREDIVTALQVPPTFVEAVERMDDALLKRSSFDVTVDKMNARITDMMVKYDDISRQTKENNEILNQLIQQDAERTVKWTGTEVGLLRVQEEVTSMIKSMDTLMEMFSDSIKPEQKSKTSIPSELPPPSGTDPETLPIEAAEATITSIAKELDKLSDEEVNKILEEKEEEENPFRNKEVIGAAKRLLKILPEDEDDLPPPPPTD